MSAFPIVERELRVSARWKSTAWLRVLVGGLAALFALTTLVWATQGPFSQANAGKTLLQTLIWFAFAFSLIEGIRQTYDSVSSERREGSLGLLLLTPLRAFDVVSGKLAAASVGSCLALLAAFPAMAIAFPAGGVTAGEFWRAQLVLINSLFLSMACGLFVSSRSWEGHRAFIGSVGLLAAICILPLLAKAMGGGAVFSALSPVSAMVLSESLAYRANAGGFWLTLAETHVLGWVLLILAASGLGALITVEEAMDTAGSSASTHREASATYRPAPSLHANPRPPLIDVNPSAWLAERFPYHQLLIWSAVFLWTFQDFGLLARFFGFRIGAGAWSAVEVLSHLLPAILLAVAASRGLAEARQNGALELLLCTPLSSRTIVQGYWRALWNRLKIPLVLAILLKLIAVAVALPSVSRVPPLFVAVQLLQVVRPVLEILAVSWMALWFAVRTARFSHTIGMTLLWTVLVPWIGIQGYWLLAGTLISALPIAAAATWIIWSGGTVAIYVYLVFLIHSARRRLFHDFRGAAAGLGTLSFLDSLTSKIRCI